MNSIILGGIRNVDLGFRILEESEEPLAPSTRDKGVVIDGRHGVYDFGAELNAKQFNYKCAFIPNGTNYSNPSAEELQKHVRRLAEHLTDRSGRPRNMRLIREWEPDKYYIARYSGSTPLERIAYSSLGFFNLPLVAFDPFAYAAQDRIYQTVMIDNPHDIDIYSSGNVSTPCLIELTNEGTNTITKFVIKNEYQLE